MSFMSRLVRIGKEARIDRIIRNLDRVLNSRERFGGVIHGLGLGDHGAQWDTPGPLDVLMEEILTAVRECEPELLEPKIELMRRGRQSRVRFVLSGLVDGEPRQFHIDIDHEYQNLTVTMPS